MKQFFEEHIPGVESGGPIEGEHFPMIIIATLTVLASLGVQSVQGTLIWLDQVHGLPELMESLVQGVCVGILAQIAYSTSNNHFSGLKEFETKEGALLIVAFASVIAGGLVGTAVPLLIEQYIQYNVVQLLGVFLVAGMFLVHSMVPNWKLENEWPHLAAGVIMLISPIL